MKFIRSLIDTYPMLGSPRFLGVVAISLLLAFPQYFNADLKDFLILTIGGAVGIRTIDRHGE